MTSTKQTTKAYNFDSSIDLTKNKYAYTVIKDVPCYSLNDINELLSSNYYSSLDFSRSYLKSAITIQTGNRRGATHHYVYATPEIEKLVREQTVFAMLKNTIKKAPKRQTKNLFVRHGGDIVIDKNKTAKYVKCTILKDMHYYNVVDAK